jgi:hypothetical protein
VWKRSEPIRKILILDTHSVLHGEHVDWTTGLLGLLGLLSLLDLLYSCFSCHTHSFLEDGSLFGSEIDGDVRHADTGRWVGGGGSRCELWGRTRLRLVAWTGGDCWGRLVRLGGEGVLGAGTGGRTRRNSRLEMGLRLEGLWWLW